MSSLHKQQNPYKKESSVHCDVCNVWIANHAQAIRNHELGESHKKRLEDKLFKARQKTQTEERQRDEAARAMGAIETAAMRAYSADVAAAVRPEDAHGPMLPPSHVLGPGARARLAEEAERRQLEALVDESAKAKQEAAYRQQAGCARGVSSAPPQWLYDAASGYHRDAASGFLYDPASQQYFDPARQAWGQTGPGEGEEEAEEYPLGAFAAPAPPPPPPPRPVMPAALSLSALSRPGQSTATAHPLAGTPAGPPPPRPAEPPATSTSAFLLGFGSLHPKFEAAKAKTAGARARVEAAAGGAAIAVAGGPRGLGRVPDRPTGGSSITAAGVKRKPVDEKKAKEEAEALARREAARKRVEARTLGSFGLS